MLRPPFDQRPEFYPPNRQDNEDDWEALMEVVWRHKTKIIIETLDLHLK